MVLFQVQQEDLEAADGCTGEGCSGGGAIVGGTLLVRCDE
jgi:hypothetical protein